MNDVQLEALAGGRNPSFMGLDHDEVITSLARRVIAADKVADAWFDDSVSNSEFADMMNTYRESRK